jgi:hypothetical protein
MHKRFAKTLASITGLLLALLAATPLLAQEEGVYAASYDIDITVLASGDMQVVERQTIVFTQGSFNQLSALLSTRHINAITNIQVAGDGLPYQEAASGSQPGTFIVENKAGQIAIMWYFDYSSNSTHVYEIHYTIKGGLRYYAKYNELWREAIPSQHVYTIERATIRVNLPPGAAILSDSSGRDSASASPDIVQITLAERRLGATFNSTRSIRAGEGLEVRVRFQAGAVSGQAPGWQANFDQQQTWDEQARPTADLLLGLAGAILLLGGPMLVLGLWYSFGRDPAVALISNHINALPTDTPPGLVGALVDEKADLQDILATLVDLARRGYMSIVEEDSQGASSGPDYTFQLGNEPPGDLRAYEQRLLDAIFAGQSSRQLSSLLVSLRTALPKLQDALYQELVQDEFFRTNPQAIRQRYVYLGAILLVVVIVGGSIALAATMRYVDMLICPLLGLGATAITLIATGPHMPHKTHRGAEAAAAWCAFRNYLAQIEKHGLPQAGFQFEEYLPYAIAFGLEHSLVSKFAAIGTPMPAWYVIRASHKASDDHPATCSRLLTLLDVAYQALASRPHLTSSLHPPGHPGSQA